jgi:hypothetical protein
VCPFAADCTYTTIKYGNVQTGLTLVRIRQIVILQFGQCNNTTSFGDTSSSRLYRRQFTADVAKRRPDRTQRMRSAIISGFLRVIDKNSSHESVGQSAEDFFLLTADVETKMATRKPANEALVELYLFVSACTKN